MDFIQLTSFNLVVYILVLSVFLGVSIYIFKQSKDVSKNYPLLFKRSYSRFRLVILSFLVTVLSIGLFQPSIYTRLDGETTEGIDVLFILDVSKSMNTLDFSDSNDLYSRIEVAKNTIANMVRSRTENRYGLIIFAGEAVSVSPLTIDSKIFLNFLQGVDYRNINTQGTNLEDAYALAIDRFTNDNDDSNGNMIILLSDGGDLDDITDEKHISSLLEKSGIAQAVIGVGTTEGGKIPVGTDVFGSIRYQQFKGRDVISKLNKRKLKNISSVNDGLYYQISDMGTLLDFENSFSQIETKAIEKGPKNSYLDLSRYLSMFCFFIFLFMLVYPVLKPKKS